MNRYSLRWSVVLLLLCGSVLAVADMREGGETIADAIIIDDFWFTDSGSTCDNLDDYDVACPYASTSSDVVYSIYYGACTYLMVQLYGSWWDTKLYLYDEQLNELACNDNNGSDTDSEVGYYSETSGMVYIVVDGSWGDCGEYDISVDTIFVPPPYPVTCPAEAEQENEPPFFDGYVDTYNGGCDAPGGGFLHPGGLSGESELDYCGTLGWYGVGGGAEQGDSDWFRFVAAGDQIVWTVDSQYALTRCHSAFITECNMPWTTFAEMTVGEGNIGTMTIPTEPGDLVTLWLEPGGYGRPTCFPGVFDYAFHVDGIEGVVAVDRRSWGALKSLYR